MVKWLVFIFCLCCAAFAVFCIRRQPDMVLPYGLSALAMIVSGFRVLKMEA